MTLLAAVAKWNFEGANFGHSETELAARRAFAGTDRVVPFWECSPAKLALCGCSDEKTKKALGL